MISLTRRRCPSWDLSSDVLACMDEARRELHTGVPSPRKGRAMDLARIVAREEAAVSPPPPPMTEPKKESNHE
jgi:hypothetical protein